MNDRDEVLNKLAKLLRSTMDVRRHTMDQAAVECSTDKNQIFRILNPHAKQPMRGRGYGKPNTFSVILRVLTYCDATLGDLAPASNEDPWSKWIISTQELTKVMDETEAKLVRDVCTSMMLFLTDPLRPQ